MEVVASLSQGRTAAAQCGLFTHKSVPVIFDPPCIIRKIKSKRFTWGGVTYTLKPRNLYKILLAKWHGNRSLKRFNRRRDIILN